ncbi:YihY/virulence factor BrkB family protein [Ornithinibacillus sp. 4-3]|uniref:YihY/virulence factor BrkB family protein n=1 Tax=Ornithinibacillus sp. 4-3 TaxID=3231488 RepID=A0AB39HMU7_9BACI
MQKIIEYSKRLVKGIGDADVLGLAAQLSYFFLLSLFPFLLFVVTLVGYLPLNEISVVDFISDYMPTEIASFINTNVSQLLSQQNGGLLSISIVGTLWSASNGLNAITKALNKAYRVEDTRFFLISRLIAVAMTIAMVLVIIISLLLPIFGEMIGIYLFSFVGLSDEFVPIWNSLRWVVSSAAIFLVLLALYIFIPNVKVRLREVLWGALFATIGWQLISLAFSYYVNTLGNYSATYGSLGTVIILMIWFYISGIIIITGGVINAVNKKDKLIKEKIDKNDED